MPVLYTLLGIILFFVLVFSVKLTLIVDYGEKTLVKIKWLFVKLTVFDSSKPKKEKKKKDKGAEKQNTDTDAEASEKKKKKTKKKQTDAVSDKGSEAESVTTGSSQEQPEAVEEKQTEKLPQSDSEKKEKKPKSGGNGLIKQIYLDHGYDGLEKMLRALGNSLGGFFGKLYKTFTIDELYITMITTGSDAADTALKYGKLCSWLYPVLGKLVSTCKVKKYDFDISPDFLGVKSKAEAYVCLHIVPIRLTNAAVVLGVQLLFKILFKILFSKKKSDKSKKEAAALMVASAEQTDAQSNTNINKEGASK